MLFLFPKDGDPLWVNRRRMAIYSFLVIAFMVAWACAMITYCIVTGKPPTAQLQPLVSVVMIAVPSLTAIVAKYIHDASREIKV